MKFRELADTLGRLEATPGRLEMRGILVDLLKPLRGKELSTVVYLVQGMLRPEYEGVELGVAESLARRAVATATGRSIESVAQRSRAIGDLGSATEEILRAASRLVPAEPLNVEEVYSALLEVARTQGDGSQELKVSRISDLLVRAEPLEAKYLVRFVIGTLRVGVREMTILDALAQAFAGEDPVARERIEAAFNLSSDLGEIAERVARAGLSGLDDVHLECGRPIRPMLAERAKALEEIFERMDGKAALEYKYDGLRVQVHVSEEGPVRLFSRRLEEIGAQFPDLTEAIPKAIRHRPVIFEGECVPIDLATGALRPFQEISRRRGRKHDLEQYRAEVPVVLFAFDILLDGTKEVYREPFPAQRAALEALLRPSERIRLAEERITSSVEEASEYFEEVIGEGAEGIVAKSLAEGSSYRAGARGYWWIKYKRDYRDELADSIDGVIVGGFHGRGRRGGRFGAYLLAVYDPKSDSFPTFCKVGSGLDDAMLEELPKRLSPSEDRPAGVESRLTPDQWFRPTLVLEVKGAELSISPIHRAAHAHRTDDSGLALRFPRCTGRLREDKAPTDATTSDELWEMFERQGAVRNRGAARRRPAGASSS